MYEIMSIKDAYDAWLEGIKPAVIEQYGQDDEPALSESWNNYTDMLCKDGNLTGLQYQYCPAFDDEMPDDDCAFILDQLGVKVSSIRIPERPDGLMTDMSDGSRHYRVLIKRGNDEMTIFYSMGSAHTSTPDECDVINSVLMDTADIDNADYEEWAENLGFDADSRKAERTFKACQETLLHLRQLFSDDELNGLREIFADY